VESVKIVRKRPVAKRLIRTWGESVITVVRGLSSPPAPKAAFIAIDIIPLPGGGSTHGSLTSSARSILRRRAHGLCTPAATTHASSKRNSKPSRSSATETEFSCDQEIKVTLRQFTVQLLAYAVTRLNLMRG